MERKISLFLLVLLLSSHGWSQSAPFVDQFGISHQLTRGIFYAADRDSRALLLETVQKLSLIQQQHWHWVLNISQLPYSVINLNLKPALLRIRAPVILDSDNQSTGSWPNKNGQVSLLYPGDEMQYFASSKELLTYINKQTNNRTP